MNVHNIRSYREFERAFGKIDAINEGGNALNTTQRIANKDIPNTLEYITTKILPTIGLEGFDIDAAVVGSAGKKDPDVTSGDIDIAVSIDKIAGHAGIDVKGVLKYINDTLAAKGYETNIQYGFNQVNVAVPIDGDTKKGYCQVDLMVTDNLDWSKFIYFSPDYRKAESRYSGAFRGMLINAVASEGLKKAVKHDEESGEMEEYEQMVNRATHGLFKVRKTLRGKKGLIKTPKLMKDYEQKISNIPKDVIKILFGDGVTEKDVESFEGIWKVIHSKNFPYQGKLETIANKFLWYMKNMEIPVPTEIVEKYPNLIKENKSDMKRYVKLYEEFSINEAHLGDKLYPENAEEADGKAITKLLEPYKKKWVNKSGYMEPRDFDAALREYIMDFDPEAIKNKKDLVEDFKDYIVAMGYSDTASLEEAKKEYFQTISPEEFAKIKKGDTVQYMATTMKVINNDGYVLDMKDNRGQNHKANLGQFIHGGRIAESVNEGKISDTFDLILDTINKYKKIKPVRPYFNAARRMALKSKGLENLEDIRDHLDKTLKGFTVTKLSNGDNYPSQQSFNIIDKDRKIYSIAMDINDPGSFDITYSDLNESVNEGKFYPSTRIGAIRNQKDLDKFDNDPFIQRMYKQDRIMIEELDTSYDDEWQIFIDKKDKEVIAFLKKNYSKHLQIDNYLAKQLEESVNEGVRELPTKLDTDKLSKDEFNHLMKVTGKKPMTLDKVLLLLLKDKNPKSMDIAIKLAPQFNTTVTESIINEAEEKQGKKLVNIMVGRFQPFHNGHYLAAKELHDKNGLPVVLASVRAKGKTGKGTSFTDATMDKMMKDVIKKSGFIIDNVEIPFVAFDTKLFPALRPQYEPVLFGAGEDRVATYDRQRISMRDKHKNKLNMRDDFEIQLTGRYGSGTAVRNAIEKGDQKEFESTMPKFLHNYWETLSSELGMNENQTSLNEANKIACIDCDEVNTEAKWKKNNGFCPSCKTSNQGVAESSSQVFERGISLWDWYQKNQRSFKDDKDIIARAEKKGYAKDDITALLSDIKDSKNIDVDAAWAHDIMPKGTVQTDVYEANKFSSLHKGKKSGDITNIILEEMNNYFESIVDQPNHNFTYFKLKENTGANNAIMMLNDVYGIKGEIEKKEFAGTIRISNTQVLEDNSIEADIEEEVIDGPNEKPLDRIARTVDDCKADLEKTGASIEKLRTAIENGVKEPKAFESLAKLQKIHGTLILEMATMIKNGKG